MFISLCNVECVLELGLFIGCMVLVFVEGILEDGKVVFCEFDFYIVDFVRLFLDKIECGKKVDIMLGIICIWYVYIIYYNVFIYGYCCFNVLYFIDGDLGYIIFDFCEYLMYLYDI